MNVKVDPECPVGQAWVSLDQTEVTCNPADEKAIRENMRTPEEAAEAVRQHLEQVAAELADKDPRDF